MNFITVEQAGKIILSKAHDFGKEVVPYETASGRILAEDLLADRGLPPFDRATMDGIAINYSSFNEGIRSFKIKATQAAGEETKDISAKNECIEIMTGAALDKTVDTVIRYEDTEIKNGTATIKTDAIKKGQSIHLKGKDREKDDKIVNTNRLITPALIGMAASIGKTNLKVKKLPRVVVISTGDEMVPPETAPTPFQLRRSNGITIKSVLKRCQIQADMLHMNDDFEVIKSELSRCLNKYDVLLMSGGVSMGKFDYIPQALDELSVEQFFHKVKQRPGKPFWFGMNGGDTFIFAFPGNPVSTFMCLHRYFVPWLEKSLHIEKQNPEYAVLQDDLSFPPSLQYFAQVKLIPDEKGQLWAKPIEGHGSGDFSNLTQTDAFMELPMDKNEFKKGEAYKVWRYSL